MADTPTAYPFDPTGQQSSNRVTGEQHVITGSDSPNFNLFVPTFAPFFPDGATLTAKDIDGTVHTLHEGIDYIVTHVFYSASLRTALRVGGSISLLNYQYKGVVSIDYNTIGGIWTLDSAGINSILADHTQNPRLTTWEQVTNRPYDFPPIDHSQDVSDFIGAKDLADAINAVENAIRNSAGGGGGTNPPVTKESIGLGNVQNYGIAGDADAQNPVSDALYMTPKKTAETIDNYPGATLTAFMARRDNPNQVTAAQTGAYTSAQTDTAINNLRVTLNQTISNLSNTLNQHMANTGNPHDTTAAQVGAYTTAQVDTLLSNKLDATGTAVNSAKWNGWDVATAMQQFKPNNAANADAVGGKSLAQLTSDITAAASANVTQIDGMTVAQLEAQFTTDISNTLAGVSAPVAGQTLTPTVARHYQYAATTASDPSIWMMLGYQNITDSHSGNQPDIEFALTGGDAPAMTMSPLYFVSIGSRTDSDGNLVSNIMNVRGSSWTTANNGAVAIGYRIQPGTGSTLNVEVWIKTPGTRNMIGLTDLMPTGWNPAPGVTQNTDPGLTYPAEITYATSADIAALKSYVDNKPATLG